VSKNDSISSLLLLEKDPVKEKKNYGTHDRANKPSRLPDLIPTNGLPQISREKRAGDSEKCGYDKTTRIFAGHKEFGNDTCDKTDNDCPQDVHIFFLLVLARNSANY
jgi:hypothetical protein